MPAIAGISDAMSDLLVLAGMQGEFVREGVFGSLEPQFHDSVSAWAGLADGSARRRRVRGVDRSCSQDVDGRDFAKTRFALLGPAMTDVDVMAAIGPRRQGSLVGTAISPPVVP